MLVRLRLKPRAIEKPRHTHSLSFRMKFVCSSCPFSLTCSRHSSRSSRFFLIFRGIRRQAYNSRQPRDPRARARCYTCKVDVFFTSKQPVGVTEEKTIFMTQSEVEAMLTIEKEKSSFCSLF